MFAIAKRIFLFLIVNFLILATLNITLQILMNVFGIELSGFSSYLVMYSVLGMGGAFISLLMSRTMAKMMMGVRVISPQTNNPGERELLEVVYALGRKAGLTKHPEVGIYESPEINAFATGPGKSRSLVAVSTGLLHKMEKSQLEGVLAHEIAHVANGDMVTMTLIQGVINTMVLLVARALSMVISGASDERSRPTVQFLSYMLLQMLLSLLGSIVVCYFSRTREYRADAGGAKLAGREKMLSALKALNGTQELLDQEHRAIASLKISGSASGFLRLFSTHPPLEERIARLEQGHF